MDRLVFALGPAFAAGFAVQQLLQIIDLIVLFFKPQTEEVSEGKKVVLPIVSLGISLILAFGAGLRVLQPLGIADADVVDALVTALIISAGTEGFNSIMKFLGYAKEDKKAAAATKWAAAAQNVRSHALKM